MLNPERVLVKETNWLGDIVMSLPALRAVRRAFPKARLSVLVKKELASFFDGAAWIDEILPYSLRKGWLRGFSDRRAIVRDLRARRFDLAVLLPNSFDSALWPALARVPHRVGFARDGRGLLLNHTASATAKILDIHQVHYYLHMLRETLGIDGSADDFKPDVCPKALARMREFLNANRKHAGRPLVALAAAAAYGPAKEWPSEHYAQLIDLLWQRHQAECVLVGAPSERRKSEDVAKAAAAGAVVAAGQTGMSDALALLSLCDAFAGNDSGSMHAAGALGLPTVGIFGSTRSDRTGPLGPRTKVLYKPLDCSPCLKRTCRFGHYDCLRRIEPAEVLQALDELK